MSELNKSGNAAQALISLGGGLKMLSERLEQTEDVAEKKLLLEEKLALYYKKLHEAVVELSEDCAAVTVLVEEFTKSHKAFVQMLTPPEDYEWHKDEGGNR